MIVLANPGAPKEYEDDVYRARPDARDVAGAACAFTAEILEGQAQFSQTLDRVLEEAGFLLSCEPARVLDQCVITNHVKCSTPESLSSYRSGEALARRRATSAACIGRFLNDEIAYWMPERVAVFSDTARDALRRARIPFDGYISHPTARGKNRIPSVRRAMLVELKAQLGL